MPALNPVPPGRTHLLWVGLLGLVMLYFAMLMIAALPIERSLARQVEQVIGDSGLSRVDAELRGRDVVLRGFVSSREAAAGISRQVKSVHGVRKVADKLVINVWKLPWLRLQWDEGGRRVIAGRLPLVALRDEVVQALSNAGVEAENRIRVDPEVAIPEWMALIQPLLESGEELERFTMEIGAGKLSVGGRLRSAGRVAFHLRTLQELVEPFALKVINRIALVTR